MRFNARQRPGLYRRIGTALELPDCKDDAVIDWVQKLFSTIGLAGGLRAHGVKDTDLEELVAQATADSCHQTNPVPVSSADLRSLYERAF